MNEILDLRYEGRAVRLHVDEEGNPWWVAKDVCDVLGLSNPSEAVRSLDDDERNTLRVSEGIQDGPGNPNMNIISESGLYTLIMRSNKPEAKQFRRWVTHEVLPSIRRTGGYRVARDAPPEVCAVQAAERRVRAAASIIKQTLATLGSVGVPAARAREAAVDRAYADTGVDWREYLPDEDEGPAPDAAAEMAVAWFVDKYCRLVSDATVVATELYDAYVTLGPRPMGRNTFYRTLLALPIGVRRGRAWTDNGLRPVCFRGIGLAGAKG